MFDPQHPVNESPNNTGARLLPPARPAMIYWPYGKSEQFPELGEGGRTACAGPVFHYRPEFARTGGFPQAYDNCLLFYDWQRPFMKWARLDRQSKFVRIEPFTGAVAVVNNRPGIGEALARGAFVIRRPEDSQFGPDGCLYMIDYGETWGANPDSKLIKISYQRGNLAPIAKAAAIPSAGREPLTLSLSSAGSKDFENDTLSYEWRLYPGDKLVSTQANPSLTLTQAGNYVVELAVSDGHGGMTKSSVPVLVGNAPPQIRFLTPQDGDFFNPGQPVPYRLLVEDQEDGSSKDYEELMDPRTFVSARWRQGDEHEEAVDPALAMMRQSDCFNCHSISQKIVGPALLDVAQKYRGQPGALDASVQRVLKGSSGVWGPAQMLAHPLITSDQIQIMVRWIYSLEPGKTGVDTTRGIAGKVAVPESKANRFGLLEATYADGGRLPVGSLLGKTTLTLRSRRVEAEEGKDLGGTEVQNVGNASGKKCVRAVAAQASVRYSSFNLSDSGTVTFRVAAATSGGAVELHRDSPAGELMARSDIPDTGGRNKWTEINAPLKSPAARCDVIAVLIGGGGTNAVSLDWIEFNAR